MCVRMCGRVDWRPGCRQVHGPRRPVGSITAVERIICVPTEATRCVHAYDIPVLYNDRHMELGREGNPEKRGGRLGDVHHGGGV